MWTPGAVVRNHTFRNSISRECVVILYGSVFCIRNYVNGCTSEYKKSLKSKFAIKSAIKYSFELCLIFELNMYQSKVT